MKITEELHQELNPSLFMDDKMRPKVREWLLDIAKEFTGSIAEDLDYKVLDVLLVGSQAGYNYTQYSDIDLHLVVNLSQNGESSEDNLIFKQLRNEGYLDKLKDMYYEIRSKELTLEGLLIIEEGE